MTGRVLRHCTFVATTALLGAYLGTTPHAQGGIKKSLFVAALDQAGKPVTGLTAQDVLIREDNTDRRVLEVKPASQPISVAVLVDTAQGKRVTDAYGTAEEYVRDLRVSVNAFAAELMGNSKDASVLLGEFGQAAMTLTPFTQSPQEIDKGVKRLVSRPDVGSVLFEALVRANGDLAKQPTARRAIVSLNLEPSDEQSREDPNKVRNSFAASGAQLWAVSVQRGGLKNSKRDLVLNDLAKFTGGQRDFVIGISAVENIMRGYAAALASQFEVVYERPENAKGVKVVLVGTARPDVKLHASVFAPQ